MRQYITKSMLMISFYKASWIMWTISSPEEWPRVSLFHKIKNKDPFTEINLSGRIQNEYVQDPECNLPVQYGSPTC